MAKIKVGIIGAGFIAGVHASVLASDDRVELVAIHDVVAECAEKLARTCNAKIAQSAAEVIDACDAVYVTTPNTKHVELALAAASANKHVFCEKPLATTVPDARLVVEAAEKSAGIFQVGHNRRFAPV